MLHEHNTCTSLQIPAVQSEESFTKEDIITFLLIYRKIYLILIEDLEVSHRTACDAHTGLIGGERSGWRNPEGVSPWSPAFSRVHAQPRVACNNDRRARWRAIFWNRRRRSGTRSLDFSAFASCSRRTWRMPVTCPPAAWWDSRRCTGRSCP